MFARRLLVALVAPLIVSLVYVRASAEPLQRSPAQLTHGMAVGDVTAHTAVVWARADRAAHLQLVVGEQPDRLQDSRQSRPEALVAEHDFAGHVVIRGLPPGTRYYYRVLLRTQGEETHSPVASFVTAPHQNASVDVSFVWGADVGQGLANSPPFPAFASIEAENPDFFIFAGDTIYGDSTTLAGPPATTLEGYWAKYKENRDDLFFQALLRRTSLVVTWDDHEVVNDFRGPYGAAELLLPLGLQAFHDYSPLSVGPDKIYRSLRWGQEVELFVLDVRQYADPLTMPDGPTKSALGLEQRTWLERVVKESNATWKVLVTSSPLSILRDPQNNLHDDWANYEYELGSLLYAWQQAGVRNLVWLTADVHWAQAIEYPAYAMWEFVGAPIGASPRTAALPLSPTFGPVSHFLGLHQRYYGAVHVNAKNRTMTVDLKLENGQTMYSTVILAQ
jgi:alkaline phosphatase D